MNKRLAVLSEKNITFFMPKSDGFWNEAKQAEIVAPMPNIEDYEKKQKEIHKLASKQNEDFEFRPCYERPLMTREQEYHLFRQLNYYKYCAKLRIDFLVYMPFMTTESQLDEIENYLEKVDKIRNHIAEANFRLSSQLLRKRKFVYSADIVLSDAYYDIFHSVDRFNYEYGTKFSTYATWALFKNSSRKNQTAIDREKKHPLGMDAFLDTLEDNNQEPCNYEARENKNTALVNRLLDVLRNDIHNTLSQKNQKKSPSYTEEVVERQIYILCEHFGINEDREKRTLEDLSHELKISKERVRQIKAKSLKILQEAAQKGILTLD